MSIPQQIIDIARERYEGRKDCSTDAFLMAEHILREAGELPEPPPEVRVPDCLHDYWELSCDDGDLVIVFETVSDGVRMLSMKVGEDLIIPVDGKRRTVAELRKMAEEYEQWKAEQEQANSEEDYIVWEPGELPQQFRDKGAVEELECKTSLGGSWGSEGWYCGDGWKTNYYRMKRSDYERLKAEDDYIVWEPGELPEQFRDMKDPLSELERECDGAWKAGFWKGTTKNARYRMKRSDYERLAQSTVADDITHGLEELKELVESASIDQLKKDHEAMNRLRNGEVHSVNHNEKRGSDLQWQAYDYGTGYEDRAGYSSDPADAILAAKVGE